MWLLAALTQSTSVTEGGMDGNIEGVVRAMVIVCYAHTSCTSAVAIRFGVTIKFIGLGLMCCSVRVAHSCAAEKQHS